MRPGDPLGSRIRKPSVKPVDQAVRFVELVAQAGHSAPGNRSCVTVHTSRAAFGRFHLFGDFVDVRVQRMKQLPRLRCVGVIDHVGIIASTTGHARAGADSANLRWHRPYLAPATIPQ
jgi:hypothetical protein